jgi:hypothetical protein
VVKHTNTSVEDCGIQGLSAVKGAQTVKESVPAIQALRRPVCADDDCRDIAGAGVCVAGGIIKTDFLSAGTRILRGSKGEAPYA